MEKGKILEESLKKIGYSLEMLTQALRGKYIFYIVEVECAILEVNGTLSSNKIPVELVIDGEILDQNLSDHHFDKEWLLDELKKRTLHIYAVNSQILVQLLHPYSLSEYLHNLLYILIKFNPLNVLF
ncbi:YetF domain-containing protein [Neobacillus drentensis]|uniref:YetF domain-containing protein n=1 Tax=Neobacillus drentensis TaxID=220684 RepID=UPI002FFFEE8B